MAEMFGKYELLKRIGAGGMAEIFLARQSGIQGFEKLLVIKRVLPKLMKLDTGLRFVEMFLDEARLAAQLNHPNIVQIYELGQVGDQFFIVMEYVPGVDLWALLKKGHLAGKPLPLPYAIKILSYVCEALSYAHDRRDAQGRRLGIVHRDVSPSNVLIAFEGGVKLTDFGIAKAITQEVKTQAGTIKGKLHYMSPEQITGQVIDHRSDLFSVGVLLYELATGALPFTGRNDYDVMAAITKQTPRPPVDVRPDFPASLQTILDRALAKNPRDRFSDALTLQVALEKYLMDQRAVVSSALLGEYARLVFGDLPPAVAERSGRPAEDSLDRALGTIDIVVELDRAAAGASPDAAAAGERTETAEPAAHYVTPSEERTAPDPVARTQTVVAAPRPPPPPPPPPVAQRARTASWRVADRRLSRFMLGAVIAFVAAAAVLVLRFLPQDPAIDPPTSARAGLPDAALAVSVSGVADAARKAANVAVAAMLDAGSPTLRDAARSTARLSAKLERAGDLHNRRPLPGTPVPPTEPGALTLDSEPWSEVWLGEVKLGVTPIAYVKLPAGRHRLLLRNPQQRIETVVWVEIESGKTLVKRVKLQ